MASQLARLAAIYSASAELNATDCCFRLNHDTTAEPNPKQHREVLFLSEAEPAQSESVYPTNLTPSPCLVHTIIHCPLQVLQNVFCSHPVNLPRLTHKLTHCVDCKTSIW